MFKTLNRHWGSAVTGLFYIWHKSEKTFYQLVHLMLYSFNYADVYQVIDTQIVKQIVSNWLTHLQHFKIRINNWIKLKSNSSPDITFVCLTTANLHYKLLEKLWDGCFSLYLHDYSYPCSYRSYKQLVLGVLI